MNEIRRTLSDISERGNRDRKGLAAYAKPIQAWAKVGEIAFGILAVVGLIKSVTSLRVGTLLTGLCGYFASRDIYVVGKNLEIISLSNTIHRIYHTFNEERLINFLTQDTRILREFNIRLVQGIHKYDRG
jgi:hypothetical protein